ncbi:MAG: hypothetical protein E7570_06660 [Ruminococcaceae bacterium]|nr:hypothetical protein [Oscillospiraceae bacterium]
MKKNIIAIICGVVAAAVIITGTLISMGKMNEKESIGSSAALTIALNDAGVGKEEAKNTKAHFEKEDGVYIFDVEFYANGNEYNYDIDASTGEILKREVDLNGSVEIKTTKAAQTETTTKISSENTSSETTQKAEKATKESTKANSKSDYIGIDSAKRIALEYVGVSESEVKFTKAKLDYDDGIAEYEVEFVSEKTEYEFEINAKTGKIIGFDKEIKSSTKNKNYDDDDDDYDDYDDDDDFEEYDD